MCWKTEIWIIFFSTVNWVIAEFGSLLYRGNVSTIISLLINSTIKSRIVHITIFIQNWCLLLQTKHGWYSVLNCRYITLFTLVECGIRVLERFHVNISSQIRVSSQSKGSGYKLCTWSYSISKNFTLFFILTSEEKEVYLLSSGFLFPSKNIRSILISIDNLCSFVYWIHIFC